MRKLYRVSYIWHTDLAITALYHWVEYPWKTILISRKCVSVVYSLPFKHWYIYRTITLLIIDTHVVNDGDMRLSTVVEMYNMFGDVIWRVCPYRVTIASTISEIMFENRNWNYEPLLSPCIKTWGEFIKESGIRSEGYGFEITPQPMKRFPHTSHRCHDECSWQSRGHVGFTLSTGYVMVRERWRLNDKLECGTWYHHPRRLQCVLSRNLRIFKVAMWHYRCRHNLKNNCIWDNLQCCLLVPRSPSKPVMLTFDLQSRKALFIEIVFWHV